MRTIDNFPADTSQTYAEVQNELYNKTTVDLGGGVHWDVFQHIHHTSDEWFVWCNEGYGLQLKEFEVDAITALLKEHDNDE